MTRKQRASLLLLMSAFLLLGGVRIGALGIPSEEILPHLFSHPKVASRAGLETAEFSLLPPYDLPDGQERSGLVIAKVWPVLSVIKPPTSYPILAEVWQSAHFSYIAALLKPMLGGSIEGLRRVALLAGALGLWLVALFAPRLSRKPEQEPWLGVIAAAWLGTSVSYLFLHRMAYLIESAPPLFGLLALYWVLEERPSRFLLAGLAAGLALSMKITMGWLFIGMALYLWRSGRFPKQSLKTWLGAIALSLLVLSPLLFFFLHDKNPAIVGRTASFLSDPLRVLSRLPRTAWITASYLGHPDMILEPLLKGQKDIKPSLWAPLLPVLFTGFAAFRVARRKEDREPELLWLCVMPSVLVFGALLYASDNPFQIAFLIAPFYALLAARALLALANEVQKRRGKLAGQGVALLAAGSLQLTEIAGFGLAHRDIGNPMFAMGAQKQIVEDLVKRGINEPITTTYNSVGFYEFLSEGHVRPVHLYPLLLPEPGMTPERYLEMAKRAFTLALLKHAGPVVMPLGYNVFEGGKQDPDIVRKAFFAACDATGVSAKETRRFPEDGPAAFGLYEVDGKPALKDPLEPLILHPAPNAQPIIAKETPAGPTTLSILGNPSREMTLGAFVFDHATDPTEGAIFIYLRSASGAKAVLEVRLFSPSPRPPASGRGYAIYYRNPEAPIATEALVDAALALAKQMEKAPQDLTPPAGLTRHPDATAN